MAVRFHDRTRIEPFAIDQASTVRFWDSEPDAKKWVDAYRGEIHALAGVAGFLREDAPNDWPSTNVADAFLLAFENDLE
jgi:hypothetical protein